MQTLVEAQVAEPMSDYFDAAGVDMEQQTNRKRSSMLWRRKSDQVKDERGRLIESRMSAVTYELALGRVDLCNRIDQAMSAIDRVSGCKS